MRKTIQLSVLGGFILLAGCASGRVAGFKNVDLTRDLDARVLERYRGEMANAAGQSGHAGHATMTLERTNWWPLGLVAYWQAGKAEMMHAPQGAYYMITKRYGWGPLALLWASKEHAAYDASGKRLSYMAMGSVAWGHLAMLHTMGSQLGEGVWMEHTSAHLAHHLLSVGDTHDGYWFSLGSDPNPASFGE